MKQDWTFYFIEIPPVNLQEVRGQRFTLVCNYWICIFFLSFFLISRCWFVSGTVGQLIGNVMTINFSQKMMNTTTNCIGRSCVDAQVGSRLKATSKHSLASWTQVLDHVVASLFVLHVVRENTASSQ